MTCHPTLTSGDNAAHDSYLLHGYVGMVDMVLEMNDEFQQTAADELARRRLGPFHDESLPNDTAAASVRLATAAGVPWESGGAPTGFAGRPLLHAWILAVFTLVIVGRRRLEEQISNESPSWAASFVILVALGGLTNAILF